MHHLVFDIGNTRTKIGRFEHSILKEKWILKAPSLSEINAILTNHSVEKIIYSTVAGIEEAIKERLVAHSFCLELTHNLQFPFKNEYQTPHTLGKDRLAGVAGALALYPHQNCLVIDAGTCITYDFLNAGNNFLGGNITPGLNMRFQAMHQFTKALPLVNPNDFEAIHRIGKSTHHALLQGGAGGAIVEMEGMIQWAHHNFYDLNVILTG
ncbi:MAG: type III pantothenate kinase, partial [Saprospiraceae bacterium]|nr:type III pantothenate kinase [Saprospiraceae bacterium]